MTANLKTSIQLILTAATTDKPQKEAVVTVGPTPDYLVAEAAFPKLDLVITGSTIDKVHFDHGITRSFLERLDEVIARPKALYNSDTVPGRSVVVTYETKAGGPIVIALQPNKLVGRQRYNVIASLYAKPAAMELAWQQRGLLVWAPKPALVVVSKTGT